MLDRPRRRACPPPLASEKPRHQPQPVPVGSPHSSGASSVGLWLLQSGPLCSPLPSPPGSYLGLFQSLQSPPPPSPSAQVKVHLRRLVRECLFLPFPRRGLEGLEVRSLPVAEQRKVSVRAERRNCLSRHTSHVPGHPGAMCLRPKVRAPGQSRVQLHPGSAVHI